MLTGSVKNRYKDCTPQETIEKIQGILNRMGIEVKESEMDTVCSACFSVRYCIEGTDIGQNGKGVTESFARASGYGEFMERLLTGFLFGNMLSGESLFSIAPDEKRYSKDEIVKIAENPPLWLRELTKVVEGSSPISLIKGAAQDNQWICFPFRHKGERFDIPAVLVQAYYASNGASAGNSYEECFVQGFSEIVERHHSVELLKKNLTPPQIDREYLNAFPEIRDLIDKIEKDEGEKCKLQFYDCSMGGEFPVVAAVLVDKTSGNYAIRFGAHPIFEIAMERTLTEMFQGWNLSTAACVDRVLSGEEAGKDIECIHNLMKAGTGAVHSGFFKKEADFTLNTDMLRAQNKVCSNKELYEKCLSYANANQLELYVRKLEIEQFYVTQILIPGYSEVFSVQGIDRLRQRKFRNEIRPFLKKGLAGADVDSLRELSLYLWEKVGMAQENTLGFLLGLPLSEEADTTQGFMNQLILTYLRLGNVRAAAEMIQMLFRYMPRLTDKTFYKCLLQMLQLIEVHEEETVAEILSVFYGEDLVHEIWHSLEEICSSAGKNKDLDKEPEDNILIRKLGFVCQRNCDSCNYQVLKEAFKQYSGSVVCNEMGVISYN